MKAQELRIGNWIQDGEANMEQVNQLLVLTGICNKINDAAYEGYYQPIRLTEEWLLKFGFDDKVKTGVAVAYYLGHNPVTHDHLIKLIKTDGDAHFIYKNAHFKIKYVHQLQNLYFALTGEEL